ncbi:MAG TPA: putative lipid II flippase FtsW [Acidimicrobiia bacterium]|jgi:cell division protein FtsW|nr:putative lipid II flippase FtsW [Acidimicrobiia bacterium]
MPTATAPTRTHRRPPAAAPRSGHYLLLIATVVVLNVVGIVMVLSASSVLSITTYGSAWYFFERQLIWTVLGAIAFYAALRIDYRRWRNWTQPLLFVTTAMLVLVLVPHFGIYVAGSRRWLGIGSWRFQPTELAKLALVLFAADLLTRREHDMHDWRTTLRPVLVAVVVLGGLIFLEPDLDSAVLLAVIAGAILLVAGARVRHLASISALGMGAFLVLALSASYRRARLLTFLHPSAAAANGGYQLVQSLIALGSGGVRGVGLGAGHAKWLFLPNAHTDFIFAVIGEELGLIGTLAVLGLFGAFAVLGIRAARRAPDRFGTLLATGITVWVVAQAAVNIGGVVGLLPVSGVPLPFVSFGGSALVFTMLATGILTNVARQGR